MKILSSPCFEIVFWILSRHISSTKSKDCENFMALWRSLIYIKKEEDLEQTLEKTLYFRVKSIYCHKLLSAREVGRKPTIGYIPYSIMWKFMKQYVMICSIKCFLQINKDSTNTHFIIYYLFNIFNKANYCMCSRKCFLKSKFCRTFWSFKNPINLLCISFSIILSRFDNRVIGL